MSQKTISLKRGESLIASEKFRPLKTLLKHIVAVTYRPLLVKYLSKTRVYRYQDIRLQISSEVFHPGFFFSTHFLLKYLLTINLENKQFLELGCGSGLISIAAAKKGAKVTATDINPVAIEYLKKNSEYNEVELTLIRSDLFKNIPAQQFDIIAINPPYYKKAPVTARDHAWYCGEKGEYFAVLFQSLSDYIHQGSHVFMVLSEECDMEMILSLASEKGFDFQPVQTKQNLLEKNFIFEIVKP